jgi:DNA-binding MarR family transcriptional regulator
MAKVRKAKIRKSTHGVASGAVRRAASGKALGSSAVAATRQSASRRASALKQLLVDLGRIRSLRDPIADLAKGLTPSQAHCMMWLQQEGPMAVTALAQRLHCAAPTITGVVDRLERLGLVERRRGGPDRRVVHVALTPPGGRMAERFHAAVHTNLVRLFSVLSDADGETLLKVIRRLVKNVKDISVVSQQIDQLEMTVP